MLLVKACSCVTIIKTSLVLFKYSFLSLPYRSPLSLHLVCLLNCPCNSFCVHCVFLSFFFLFLYSFDVSLFFYFHRLLLYMQQLTISPCCFLHKVLTPKLLSPQYLGLQSILCYLHFLMQSVYINFRVESIVHS